MRVNDTRTNVLLMAVNQANIAVNCLSRQPHYAITLKKVSVDCIGREIGIIPPVLEMEKY